MTIDKSVLVPLDVDQTFASSPTRTGYAAGRRSAPVSTCGRRLRPLDHHPSPHGRLQGVVKEVEPGKRLVITWGLGRGRPAPGRLHE